MTAEYLEDVSTQAGDTGAALAYHWREAGEADRAVEQIIAAADLAGRGWAKARAVSLYAQALELVPEDDAELRREIVRKRALAAAAAMHVQDVERDRQRPRPDQAAST